MCSYEGNNHELEKTNLPRAARGSNIILKLVTVCDYGLQALGLVITKSVPLFKFHRCMCRLLIAAQNPFQFIQFIQPFEFMSVNKEYKTFRNADIYMS